MRFQLMKGDQYIDGIMASGAGETKKQRDVCVQLTVVAGELEQGIAVIILVKVTVLPPGNIVVRIMTGCKIIGRTADGREFTAVPSRGDMSMDSRAIAGNDEIFLGDQTAFEGGYNSYKTEKRLKSSFEIKRNVFPCIRLAITSVILGFDSAAFWPLHFDLSGFLRFQEAGRSFLRL